MSHWIHPETPADFKNAKVCSEILGNTARTLLREDVATLDLCVPSCWIVSNDGFLPWRRAFIWIASVVHVVGVIIIAANGHGRISRAVRVSAHGV